MLPLADHLLQLSQVALDFVGGIDHLVGVVDHARRDEDHQLGAALFVDFEPNAAPRNGMRCSRGTPAESYLIMLVLADTWIGIRSSAG